MKCEKCEQQTKFWQYKLEFGAGCTDSYHCYQCHTTYIADTNKAKQNINEKSKNEENDD
jgi:hypothetical protein